MRTLLFIGMGGFIGSVLRYTMARYVQASVLSSFPFGTLTVNVAGCLLLGIIYGILEKGTLISPDLRLMLTVGVCGGFTTFSTFSAENFFLLRDGQIFYFLLYTFSSVFFCLLAVYLGYVISKLF